ncbi:ankyrin repeat-containing domain protein [Apiospora kogelbergensis]|uniref:Ankyrin repeat-containing domain protein n=1 Tax=Apiospora kogelbergensis TaxID=1337665 RepID=A0AAW0R6I1_9PEZI
MPPLSSYKLNPDLLLVDSAYGYNPLLEISAANDVEAFEEGLENYRPDDWPIPGGQGDLFEEAIRHGSVNCYRTLVAYQKVQAAADSERLSLPYLPLHKACRWRRLDMVCYLMSTLDDDVEANITTTDHLGLTPLLLAYLGIADLTSWAWEEPTPAEALYRSEEIVGMLLDRGASVRILYYRHYAHQKRDVQIVCDYAEPGRYQRGADSHTAPYRSRRASASAAEVQGLFD